MPTVHLYIDIGTYNILNWSCSNFQARLSRDSSQLSSLSYIKLVSGWHPSPASLPLNHFPCFRYISSEWQQSCFHLFFIELSAAFRSETFRATSQSSIKFMSSFPLEILNSPKLWILLQMWRSWIRNYCNVTC